MVLNCEKEACLLTRINSDQTATNGWCTLTYSVFQYISDCLGIPECCVTLAFFCTWLVLSHVLFIVTGMFVFPYVWYFWTDDSLLFSHGKENNNMGNSKNGAMEHYLLWSIARISEWCNWKNKSKVQDFENFMANYLSRQLNNNVVLIMQAD